MPELALPMAKPAATTPEHYDNPNPNPAFHSVVSFGLALGVCICYHFVHGEHLAQRFEPGKPQLRELTMNFEVLYSAAHAGFPDSEPLGGGKAVADYLIREWRKSEPFELTV